MKKLVIEEQELRTYENFLTSIEDVADAELVALAKQKDKEAVVETIEADKKERRNLRRKSIGRLFGSQRIRSKERKGDEHSATAAEESTEPLVLAETSISSPNASRFSFTERRVGFTSVNPSSISIRGTAPHDQAASSVEATGKHDGPSPTNRKAVRRTTKKKGLGAFTNFAVNTQVSASIAGGTAAGAAGALIGTAADTAKSVFGVFGKGVQDMNKAFNDCTTGIRVRDLSVAGAYEHRLEQDSECDSVSECTTTTRCS